MAGSFTENTYAGIDDISGPVEPETYAGIDDVSGPLKPDATYSDAVHVQPVGAMMLGIATLRAPRKSPSAPPGASSSGRPINDGDVYAAVDKTGKKGLHASPGAHERDEAIAASTPPTGSHAFTVTLHKNELYALSEPSAGGALYAGADASCHISNAPMPLEYADVDDACYDATSAVSVPPPLPVGKLGKVASDETKSSPAATISDRPNVSPQPSTAQPTYAGMDNLYQGLSDALLAPPSLTDSTALYDNEAAANVYEAKPATALNQNAMVGQVMYESRGPGVIDDAVVPMPLYETNAVDPSGRPVAPGPNLSVPGDAIVYDNDHAYNPADHAVYDNDHAYNSADHAVYAAVPEPVSRSLSYMQTVTAATPL